MGSLPNHHDVLTALVNLCTNAIMECEAQLEQEKVSDMAEAKWLEEEQKARENEARMLAEQQEKERQEKMEKDTLEIEAAERESVIWRPKRKCCTMCRRGLMMMRRMRRRRAVNL